MAGSQVDIQTVVGTGVMDMQVVEYARDLIAGYSGDYLFFQYSDDEYVLALTEEIEFSNGHFVLGESEWYGILIDRSTSSVPISESGSVSGSYSGYPSAGGFGGSYNGSFSVTVQNPPVFHVFSYVDSDGVSVGNPNHYLVYSSLDGYPHLIKGVEHYAFLQTGIILCVCFFVLFARIFKHVSD